MAVTAKIAAAQKAKATPPPAPRTGEPTQGEQVAGKLRGFADVKPEKPKFKIPKTLGACADRLYALRELKAAAQKSVDAIEAEYNAIREYVIETLPKSEASGVAGRVGRVAVVRKEVPQVEDWTAFYAYVKKNNAFELLQRRLGDAAVKERWDAGKVVPGVTKFTAVTISLTKA
jgi:hypothetical protein